MRFQEFDEKEEVFNHCSWSLDEGNVESKLAKLHTEALANGSW